MIQDGITEEKLRGVIVLTVSLALVIGASGYVTTREERFYACAEGTPRNLLWHENEPMSSETRVLLVHSYYTGYPWVDAITRGVRMALSGSKTAMQMFYMDTKRNTDEAFKRKMGQMAIETALQWRPDVVIAADDNAQLYFAKEYAELHGGQIVFCGVNADPQEYGFPTANVTGILERPHFKASVDLLRGLVPGVRRIALVSDSSPTSAGALASMRQERVDAEIVLCKMPATFEQWKSTIQACQDSADAIAIYMYHTIRSTASATSMEPSDVMEWTVAHSSIPIIGFFIFSVDDGALCGYAESGVEHGLRAGQMVLEIAKDAPGGRLEVVTALDGHSMLNMNTAKKLGIHVPEGLKREIQILVED